MYRRSFFQLLAAAAAAPRSLFASPGAVADTRPQTGPSQEPRAPPTLRGVSSYGPAPTPGMPGPYPGRVVSVKSDRCVDTSTDAANDEGVREMMPRGNGFRPVSAA